MFCYGNRLTMSFTAQEQIPLRVESDKYFMNKNGVLLMKRRRFV